MASSQEILYDMMVLQLFITMSFKSFASTSEGIRSTIKGDLVQIELETRLQILPLIEELPTEKYEMIYYSCPIYPTLIFRKRVGDYYIQSKELIEKRRIDGYMVYLSAEQKFSPRKINLYKKYTRKITRYVLQESPLAEVKECDGEYTLEVEFDLSNYHMVKEIMQRYELSFFPLKKPEEIDSVSLSRKISNGKWLFSYKADGQHALLIRDNKMNEILYYSDGRITDTQGVDSQMVKPVDIYEVEVIGNDLYVFDYLMMLSEDITYMPYSERMMLVDKNKKKIYEAKDVEKMMQEKPDYPYDGYIITNENRRQSYKSKFVNTVDLRHKNGILYLENELISNRIYYGNKELEEDKIYEFTVDLEMIRIRNDKNKANYRFPYDDRPLEKVWSGIGAPSFRAYYDRLRKDMMRVIPKEYSIIKEEHLYEDLKYDAVSIFYTGWSDNFVDIIAKSKIAVFAVLAKPINYESPVFSCKVRGDSATLKISYLIFFYFQVACYNKSLDKIKAKGFDIKQISRQLYNGTKDEKILASLFKFYICRKNEL